MKKRKEFIFCISFLFLIQSVPLAQEKDVEGSGDYPLLSRMENFYISGFNLYDFESHEFYDAADKEYSIEGKKWVVEYSLREGFRAPGQLKVRKNYIDAVRKMGGTILFEEGLYMKIIRDNKEIWIDIWVDSDGSDYRITVVEKEHPAKKITLLESPTQIEEETEDPELQRVKGALAEIKNDREAFLSTFERIEQDVNWCLKQICPEGVDPAPPIPIPYPKIGKSYTNKDTKSAAADRAEIILKKSEVTKSEGDELGTTVKKLKNLIQSRINRGDLSEKDKTAFTKELISHQQKAKELAELFEKYVEEVEKLLEIWKDADPGIAEVEDARKRLTGSRDKQPIILEAQSSLTSLIRAG